MDRPYVDREVDDAYTPMNYNVVTLIRQDPAYKKMTFNDVLERIMNHEMNIQEANNIKNLYKGVSTSKKQDIAIKATNKSKKKKAIIESLTEKEEDEDEKEYDEEEMALFIKKFNKFISKRRPFKGDKKERPRSKRLCDNCGKNGNFIAQCPYEKREEDIEKKKMFDKGYKKNKKFTKKKPYGQAHVSQEWNTSDESSESKSDDLATIAIKGNASSKKSLFPNLSKYTCLMAKESKKKVKSKASSSPKYVTSDNYASSNDDGSLPIELVKNPNAMIKGLMNQVGARDELPEQQEELLGQERKISEELMKLLAL
jgi:hypothetical protein